MTVNQKNGVPTEAVAHPTEFSFSENQKLKAIILDEQPWFIAKDVCNVLGLGDKISQAIHANEKKGTTGLDDDEKLRCKIYTSGQHRHYWLVNESGIYNLIFKSRNPEAKAFRKWVTSEVLPKLRKTGSYETPKAQEQPKAIPAFGTVKDGEPFATNLGDVMTHSVIKDGTIYTAMGRLAKYLGYSHFESAQRKRIGLENFVQVDMAKQDAYFVSLKGVEELLRFTKMDVPGWKVAQIYLLFGMEPPAREEHSFRYTTEQMMVIMQEMNKKPVNKTRVLELLFKGGAL